MQQETTKSIKGWVIIVGVLGLIPIFNLSSYPIVSGIGILSVISAILALAVLYAGIRTNSLSLQTIIGIFWAQFAYLVIDFFYLILNGHGNIIRLFFIVIEAIVVLVLIRDVKKLFQTLQQMPQPPVN